MSQALEKMPYNEKLEELNLFNLSEKSGGDLIMAYKYLHGEKIPVIRDSLL